MFLIRSCKGRPPGHPPNPVEKGRADKPPLWAYARSPQGSPKATDGRCGGERRILGFALNDGFAPKNEPALAGEFRVIVRAFSARW